ncbi:Helix-loop-helix DNA-binding domain protein [Onchocerca flexuosa]|uniref:Helix-loop-helix DNA-binding domain protein n=1 Tax=Onchocerca flexuosa TaxID=387005 RepID=A0A238C010_9BILA|nr:Helix-loop-helix DNA-binding domain protein [Onchocerca flexuosa]
MDFAPNSPLANRISNNNNHSEIEKRRRDRMNELMGQLATLIPSTFRRKLDKLSLLRLALDHISTMRTSNDKELNRDCCANHVIFSDLLTLLKNNVQHFVAVVEISSGKILYASDEMRKFLGDGVLARNWYEILHPIDAAIFKKETSMECRGNVNTGDSVCETVSSSTGYYKQKVEWNLGFRRSFSCRLQVYNSKHSDHSEQNYEYFHCYGSLRHVDKPVLMMLLIKLFSSPIEERFQITVTPNGQIIRCGSGLPYILKHLPQDLTGCYYYDLIHEGDLLDVAYHHKQVLRQRDSREMNYRIRAVNKHCIKVNATWIPFTNPWNLKTQFIIINHRSSSVRRDEESSPEQSVLRQLLSSNKRSQRNYQEITPELAVLGVARLAESVAEAS